MSRADEMEAWLRDKAARTVEERFGAEVIMEQVERQFFAKKGWQWELTWDEERERKKARRLNPAYKPHIHYGVLRERVASIADEITALSVESNEERYVRDVSFLQFFPEQDSDVAVYQEKQKGHPMAEALWSRLWVFEKGIFVSQREQAAMEHLMGRKAGTP